jgi:D-serine deaminase-like pyridoxal phosphate-dependent protein
MMAAPLPSKAELVQQFVGKSLYDIPLPAAVLDIAAVKRNCKRMLDAVEELRFDFLPLVNTHKVKFGLAWAAWLL